MFLPSKKRFKHVLLYEFYKCINANTAPKSILSFYRDDSLNETSCKRSFSKFLSGDFCLKGEDKGVSKKKKKK